MKRGADWLPFFVYKTETFYIYKYDIIFDDNKGSIVFIRHIPEINGLENAFGKQIQ